MSFDDCYQAERAALTFSGDVAHRITERCSRIGTVVQSVVACLDEVRLSAGVSGVVIPIGSAVRSTYCSADPDFDYVVLVGSLPSLGVMRRLASLTVTALARVHESEGSWAVSPSAGQARGEVAGVAFVGSLSLVAGLKMRLQSACGDCAEIVGIDIALQRSLINVRYEEAFASAMAGLDDGVRTSIVQDIRLLKKIMKANAIYGLPGQGLPGNLLEQMVLQHSGAPERALEPVMRMLCAGRRDAIQHPGRLEYWDMWTMLDRYAEPRRAELDRKLARIATKFLALRESDSEWAVADLVVG